MLIKKHKHLTKIVNNRHNQTQVSFNNLPLPQLQQPHLRQHGLTYSCIMVLGVMSMMLLFLPLRCVDAVGYSYTRFVGPVAGPEHEIFIDDAISGSDDKAHYYGSDASRMDYVGKPEYEFEYGVEDADAHIFHNRNEMRDGDAVKGVYSLVDPDGALRVVKYTADEANGFQAEVIRNGVSSLHGQLQDDYIHTPPPKAFNYNPSNYFKTSHHYLQPHLYLKGDRTAHHPSSITYKPNLVQFPQNSHETPSQPPIIYHYNKNRDHNLNDDVDDEEENDDDDVDDDDDDSANNKSHNDYHVNLQPHYEVHEKPDNDYYYNPKNRPPQYEVYEKTEEDKDQEDQIKQEHKRNQENQKNQKNKKNKKSEKNQKNQKDQESQKNQKDQKDQKEQKNQDSEENRDYELYDEDGYGLKSKPAKPKDKKKNPADDYYNYGEESEELDDFDTAAHANLDSEESIEYY